MGSSGREYRITRMAVFADKQLEDEYFTQDVFSSLRFVRRIVLLCAIVFFAVSLYDVVYYEFDASRYVYSLTSRTISLAVGLAFYFFSPKCKKASSIVNFITLFECTVVFGYIFLLYSQRAQGFLEQAMAIMLMIFAIYMFPNRLANLLVISVSIVALFCILAQFYVDDLSPMLLIEVVIVLGAAIIIATAYFYRDNYNKRRQYAESQMRAYLSVTDKLTGIYNRTRFDEVLEDWCNTGRQNPIGFSIVLFDIDHFKQINDRYGHLTGDRVLQQLTEEVLKNIRSEDIFARWGGEEFVILLPAQPLQQAQVLAQRLRQQVQDASFAQVDGVTISLGVTCYQSGDTPEILMRRVDKAMYKAKEGGRNQVAVQLG